MFQLQFLFSFEESHLCNNIYLKKKLKINQIRVESLPSKATQLTAPTKEIQPSLKLG